MEDVCNMEHCPEPFLVRFIHPHHHVAGVAHHFLYDGHKVKVRPWRMEDNAKQVDLCHHVRLCIEGQA
jgi:hypothetical protein